MMARSSSPGKMDNRHVTAQRLGFVLYVLLPNHFVRTFVISSDGWFSLSSSWDYVLCIWNLNTS